MKKIYFLVLALVLSACAAQPAPEPTATNTAVPPTNTPIPPTATPQPTDTPEPTPTPDPLIFRDDFEGVLSEGWAWTNENKRYWSLTTNDGWLEIMAGSGSVGNGRISNLLLRPGPEGNFELETKLIFRPQGNYQIAGLIIYESAANFIQFGRAFCGHTACSGDGFYMDLISNGNAYPENFSTEAPDLDTVFVRLRYEAGYFTGYVSDDGLEWRLIGSHYCDTIAPLFVGVLAGQASGTVPKPAQFDYFVMNALP